MSRIRSDRPLRRLALIAGLLALGGAAPLAAQDFSRVLSHEVLLSSRESVLKLELDGERALEIALRDDGVFIDGTRVGDAQRGGELDRHWRDLMTRAMDASAVELPQLLSGWQAPGDMGARIQSALMASLQPTLVAPTAPVAPAAPVAPSSDSLNRLVERINELERELESQPSPVVVRHREERARGPVHYITEGMAGIFSILVLFAVLFAIAFGVIAFGGRKYIEGVADTARHATGRSFLVGIAAAFLVVPAFILGCIALIISIVGIPGLLVWLPGFPVAVVLGILLGYLAVAHAAGEAFAERRYYVTDWFQRGNSYYFLLSGLGLMLAFFLASRVIHMAGPWLGAISGILVFLGGVTTFVALSVGFGAVLISRAGTRPVRGSGRVEEQDLFTEEAGV
jgi:MFS family permease